MNAADLTKPNVPNALPLAVGESEAARLLSVSSRTLFNWRTDGSGPRWVKAGSRVLYSVDELRRWLADAVEPVATSPLPAEQGIIPRSPAEQAKLLPPAVQAETGKQPAVQAISPTGGAS